MTKTKEDILKSIDLKLQNTADEIIRDEANELENMVASLDIVLSKIGEDELKDKISDMYSNIIDIQTAIQSYNEYCDTEL